MISFAIVTILAAVVVAILLKNAMHALLMIGAAFGIFFLSCYAFDADWRVVLSDGARTAHHEYRAHRHELRQWL